MKSSQVGVLIFLNSVCPQPSSCLPLCELKMLWRQLLSVSCWALFLKFFQFKDKYRNSRSYDHYHSRNYCNFSVVLDNQPQHMTQCKIKVAFQYHYVSKNLTYHRMFLESSNDSLQHYLSKCILYMTCYRYQSKIEIPEEKNP